MRPYREIAALAGLQVIWFLFLSHLEPNFFLLHFYQTVVYLAILIMLFYMEDRWAYMIGIIAPAMWLVMTFASGLLGGALRQVLLLGRGQGPTNPVSFLAAVTALLSVLMSAACARRWKKEYAGLGKSVTTFAISFGIVAVYYGILVAWFWHMIPFLSAQNS
jgi:riboflavin transporter FmnP